MTTRWRVLVLIQSVLLIFVSACLGWTSYERRRFIDERQQLNSLIDEQHNVIMLLSIDLTETTQQRNSLQKAVMERPRED